jgi:hypothetical protein
MQGVVDVTSLEGQRLMFLLIIVRQDDLVIKNLHLARLSILS